MNNNDSDKTTTLSEDYSATPWKDPAQKPFIEFRSVTKKFGDFTAVDEVSQNIYKGELFTILGGSGCGKSTLLRMLAGFEAPSAVAMDRASMDLAKRTWLDSETSIAGIIVFS